MSVDLPAELSPTRPRISPGYSMRSTSRRARTAPKDLLMPLISTMGVRGAGARGAGASGACSGMSGFHCGDSPVGEPVSPGAENVGLPDPDVDQHGNNQDQTDEDVHPVLRQHE